MATLVARDLRKSFGGVEAIADLSLTLRPGLVTGLVGPNGAGKTTFFDLATGFVRPDAGTMEYDGQSVIGLAPYAIRQLGVARTWQDVRVFGGMTVLDNLMLARAGQLGERLLAAALARGRRRAQDADNRDACLELLARVGIEGRAQLLASELSYAEQKLLAMARALAGGARCLLLDEPMSGLDDSTLRLMGEIVRQVAAEGATVCLVEHNVDFVRDTCDHVIFLSAGRALAEGKPHEIIASRELSAIYFGE